jgi:hypothetical protein
MRASEAPPLISLTAFSPSSLTPPHPPQNDGTATGSSEGSTVADACSCSCATGWEGPNCEVESCPACPSANYDTTGSVEGQDCGCACGAGWTGDDCELEACACSNGGVPSGTSVPDGDCSCACIAGWTGDDCELEAITDSNIKTAVDAWIADPGAAEATYTHISNW